MDIVTALRWRYATKKMTGAVVPEEKLKEIIESAHLAPSGIGLQPYEILVISNASWKERILPVAMNQSPVIQSSHLLVFAAWDQYSPERIDHVFDHQDQERLGATTASVNQRNFAKSYFARFTPEEHFHHAAKQAHIALGLAIAAAALAQVDATPMEGFDALGLDKLLNLKEKGLRSTMLLALGYRDPEQDWNLPLKKVRKPLHELITEIK